jgi:hypothetical protein
LSVHGSIPDYHKHELERIAYYTTKLFEYILHEKKVFGYPYLRFKTATINFIEYYKDEKNNKVRKKLKDAAEKVKKGTLEETKLYDENWETIHVECPICGKKGNCFGETEESILSEDEIDLIFECDSFECSSCGLKLNDVEELSLAGMETSIEINDLMSFWLFERY